MSEQRFERAPAETAPAADRPSGPPSTEPLPPAGWRCEFARWIRRRDGSAHTGLKPDLFVSAWACANILILMMAWTQPPSRYASWVLSVPSGAFLLHACWLLLRRHVLELGVGGREIRGGSRLGGRRRTIATAGLRAIQLVERPTGLAADGHPAPPDQQALLVFGGEAGPRREALVEARAGTAEDARRLARELATLLDVEFLDHTRDGAGPASPHSP